MATTRLTQLKIDGMHCASCVGGVEQTLKAMPGVHRATVNLATREAWIETVEGAPSVLELCQAIERLGYIAEPTAENGSGVESTGVSRDDSPAEAPEVLRERRAWRGAWMAGVAALPVVVLGMLHRRGPILDGIQLVGTVACFAVAWRSVVLAGLAAAWARRPDMNTLVLLGTGAAMVASVAGLVQQWTGAVHHAPIYFEAAAVTLAFVLLGRRLEARAMAQAGEALRELRRLAPATACRLRSDGAEEIVAASAVVPGDRIIVRPGDAIPVDGTVVLGRSEVDEAMLTGESVPVGKQRGAEVYGGTINGTGNFQMRATRRAVESAGAQMVRAVEEAQADKPPVQRLADRVSAVFVPGVLAVALVTLGMWRYFGGGWDVATGRAVAVLVVACPCALGLAVPAAVLAATATAARLGLLFRNATALERLAHISTVVFDKTGTLTLGKPEVVRVQVAAGISEDDLLGKAAAVEQGSEHPWAVAIREAWRGRAVEKVDGFEALPGRGVSGTLAGMAMHVGSIDWFRELGISTDAPDAQGQTVVGVAGNGALLGWIFLRDTPGPNAKEAVSRLKALGLDVVLITGDRAEPAAVLAAEFGIGRVESAVRHKAERIAALQAEGQKVAMVGDGLNDAAAIARADVGISLQSATGLALRSSDLIVVGRDLRGVAAGIGLARRARRIILENLGWALGYNLAGIPLAAGVFMRWGVALSPAVAGVFMALSSVAVVTNSMRLLRRESLDG